MADKQQPLHEILAQAAEKQPQEVAKTGPSLGEILHEALGKVWDAAVPMAEHGAAELMSAAYTGNAFVAYGWSSVEPGNEQVASQTPEPTKEVEQDRGLER